jgi:hypothetical protein
MRSATRSWRNNKIEFATENHFDGCGDNHSIGRLRDPAKLETSKCRLAMRF